MKKLLTSAVLLMASSFIHAEELYLDCTQVLRNGTVLQKKVALDLDRLTGSLIGSEGRRSLVFTKVEVTPEFIRAYHKLVDSGPHSLFFEVSRLNGNARWSAETGQCSKAAPPDKLF